MSWQAYVDTNMVKSGNITKGAIFGLDGNKWAISPGYNVTPDEAKKIIAAFKNPADIRASGLFIASVKHIALKCDERSVYAKVGTGGIVCVKTGKCVLIGAYDEKVQPGAAANVVEKLADYLIEAGY